LFVYFNIFYILYLQSCNEKLNTLSEVGKKSDKLLRIIRDFEKNETLKVPDHLEHEEYELLMSAVKSSNTPVNE